MHFVLLTLTLHHQGRVDLYLHLGPGFCTSPVPSPPIRTDPDGDVLSYFPNSLKLKSEVFFSGQNLQTSLSYYLSYSSLSTSSLKYFYAIVVCELDLSFIVLLARNSCCISSGKTASSSSFIITPFGRYPHSFTACNLSNLSLSSQIARRLSFIFIY